MEVGGIRDDPIDARLMIMELFVMPLVKRSYHRLRNNTAQKHNSPRVDCIVSSLFYMVMPYLLHRLMDVWH